MLVCRCREVSRDVGLSVSGGVQRCWSVSVGRCPLSRDVGLPVSGRCWSAGVKTGRCSDLLLVRLPPGSVFPRRCTEYSHRDGPFSEASRRLPSAALPFVSDPIRLPRCSSWPVLIGVHQVHQWPCARSRPEPAGRRQARGATTKTAPRPGRRTAPRPGRQRSAEGTAVIRRPV